MSDLDKAIKRQYWRTYYSRHPEKVSAHNKAYRAAHLDKAREAVRQWYAKLKADPERLAEQRKKRHAYYINVIKPKLAAGKEAK
jgi:bisphosphoglycerate-dependent phosphoglycerate mutase